MSDKKKEMGNKSSKDQPEVQASKKTTKEKEVVDEVVPQPTTKVADKAPVNEKEDGASDDDNEGDAVKPKKESSKKDKAKPKEKADKKRLKRKQYRLCGGSTIKKILSSVHPGMRISHNSRCILENMVSDLVKRMIVRSSEINTMRNNRVLMKDSVISAIRLVMPKELALRAIDRAKLAVETYTKHYEK